MIELRSGDRRAAFEVPFHVYEAASPYVSPMWSDFDRFLDPAKNPLAREGRGAFALFTGPRSARNVTLYERAGYRRVPSGDGLIHLRKERRSGQARAG